MFCPKCGSNQGERRFCTTCGTNLTAVSQALQNPSMPPIGQPPGGSQYLPPPVLPYDLERRREYENGMKLLILGSAGLAYTILRMIFSFGRVSFGFWGFIGVILFAIGLAKVLSWRQQAGLALPAVFQFAPLPQQAPIPAATPRTAQLQQLPKPTPQPVFSALQPGTRTDELESARLTEHAAVSATEDNTLQLPSQKANWKME